MSDEMRSLVVLAVLHNFQAEGFLEYVNDPSYRMLLENTIPTFDYVFEEAAGKAPPCPHPNCKNPSTSLMPDARGELHIFCKQCGRTDGAELPKAVGTCCGNFLPQIVSGQIRCGNCGFQSSSVPVAVGVSRADYARRVGRHSSFGRF